MMAFRRRPVAATGPAQDAPAERPRTGATAAGAAAGAGVLLARAIRIVTGVFALIIAIGIAFVVFDANPGNTIVSHVHDWAQSLAGPFDGMFRLHGPKTSVALNWGIAAIVWLVIGSLLARIVLAPAFSMRRWSRTNVRA
jgi:hypothetical protein